MSRFTAVLSAAVLTVGAAVIPLAGGAGATESCVAWASLPARVALGGGAAEVRSTLQGTAACQAATLDSGAQAVLNGPGPSTSDYPMLWSHLGARDSVSMYAGVTVPGVYRISGAQLHTYDERFIHIPATWRSTATTVKYAGRFTGITRTARTISATLQFHDKYNWRAHGNVHVVLQARTASGAWRTVADTHSSPSGRVAFSGRAGQYRLASASTSLVWGTSGALSSSRA